MSKILKKNSSGYGYNYVDLNSILNWLESEGITVEQQVRVIGDQDYIETTYTYTEDGKHVKKTMLGCRIVMPKSMGGGKVNECQQYGSAITYMRRYSIVMNLGLGSDDDDANCCNVYFPQTKEEILGLFKKMCENDTSKKTVINVVKKKMGFEQPAKELDYEELAEIYKTVINN